jgi:hypothetical protein
MKARYLSRCRICNADIKPGDDVGKWCGSWVHLACKEDRKEAPSRVIEIPSKVIEIPDAPQGRQAIRPKRDFGKPRAYRLW